MLKTTIFMTIVVALSDIANIKKGEEEDGLTFKGRYHSVGVDGKQVSFKKDCLGSMQDSSCNAAQNAQCGAFILTEGIELYQRDLRNFGSDEMVRQGRLKIDSSKIETLTENAQEKRPIELSKRSHVAFIAFRKEGERTTWASSVFQQEGCSGGFLIDANLVVWDVSDFNCGFVLYKDDWCRGPISFDTRGFNVNSKGSRSDPGFRSLYFKCF